MYCVSPSTLEELDRVRAPAGRVAGELLEDEDRSFAAAEQIVSATSERGLSIAGAIPFTDW